MDGDISKHSAISGPAVKRSWAKLFIAGQPTISAPEYLTALFFDMAIYGYVGEKGNCGFGLGTEIGETKFKSDSCLLKAI